MNVRTREVPRDSSVQDSGAPTVCQAGAGSSSLPSGGSVSREGMDWLGGV